jgi:hypothetical protein
MAKIAISFTGKLESSSVQTNKQTESSIIFTTIKGIALEGMLANYSKPMESAVFHGPSWDSINFPLQANYWVLKVSTIAKQQIAELPGCLINSIKFKRKEQDINCTMKIKHQLHGDQAALETAVSTDVVVEFTKDESTPDPDTKEEKEDKE